jgi:hypothetical protein
MRAGRAGTRVSALPVGKGVLEAQAEVAEIR